MQTIHRTLSAALRPQRLLVVGALLSLAWQQPVPAAETSSLYRTPADGTHTRWISPENPGGTRGAGGTVNRGAKGQAFCVIAPGERKILMDVKGAGIVQRIWISGNVPRVPELRRQVRIDMFWDGAETPAVSAPIGDFFGTGLGLLRPFESALFQSPEGRSFNATVPMPFRSRARIVLTNESPYYALVWYDINYLELTEVPADALYFHAAWRREERGEAGVDFRILPLIKGRGRYLGTNLGVLGNPAYRGTWFGEGEVKIYLDGDSALPTLVGTGTEDYIGTGWGQGEFSGRYFGSLLSDSDQDRYAFYRYHLDDAVYFHKDIQVTIQKIGSADRKRLLAMPEVPVPVWVLDTKGQDVMRMKNPPEQHFLAAQGSGAPSLEDDAFPLGSTNYWRSGDDISATVYFYLDRPENGLPPLVGAEERVRGVLTDADISAQ